MKIIFLNVDGVLNYSEYFKTDEYQLKRKDYDSSDIQDEKVRLLSEIVQATNVKIVLSSTWRLLRPRKGDDLLDKDRKAHIHAQYQYLLDCLSKYGMEIYSHTHDMSISGWARGNEIRDWLNEHEHDNIESFVILDDESGMCEFKDKLVKTDFFGEKGGLQKEHIEEAIKILNKI